MPGVCLQTVTLLCWTIAERIKPTLLIKQMDHAMLKLQLDAEDLYEALYHIVNVITTTDKINGGPMRDVRVHPSKLSKISRRITKLMVTWKLPTEKHCFR